MNRAGIQFYGLLYIDRARNFDVNLRERHLDPVDVYIGCAALAAKSARANGIDFGLFTNDAATIRKVVDRDGLDPFPIEEIDFSLDVPLVKEFYSAHFKIDVIKALASGEYGDLVGMIDLDTLFLRGLHEDVSRHAREGFCVYQTDDVFAFYGTRKVLRDLETVAGTAIEDPKWYGGEFLVATPANMRILHEVVEICWPRYVANIKSMRHIGDEVAVSAALNILRQRGIPVTDLGNSRAAVGRWWSAPTSYPQRAFEELQRCFLLHLPSDKPYLAEQARHPFTPGSFLENYKAHAARKISRLRRRRPFDFWSHWPRVALEAAS
jgi:hypothetical protein